MAYTDETSILQYLGLSSLPSPLTSASITAYIAAVEKWIETYCGREFEQESASYKLYDGNGEKELLVDDIISLTKIEILDEDGNVDYTLDSSSYYYLYPANKTPKTKIVINGYNAPVGTFLKGNQNIKVTATFGYASTVPADIKLATSKLVAGIIEEKYLSQAGDIKSETLGEYSITVQDIEQSARKLGVMDILDRYRVIGV